MFRFASIVSSFLFYLFSISEFESSTTYIAALLSSAVVPILYFTQKFWRKRRAF